MSVKKLAVCSVIIFATVFAVSAVFMTAPESGPSTGRYLFAVVVAGVGLTTYRVSKRRMA